MMKRSFILSMLLSGISFFLFSCLASAPLRLYEGPDLGPSEVVTVTIPTDIDLLSVDGRKTTEYSAFVAPSIREIKLAPGEHELAVRFSTFWEHSVNREEKFKTDLIFLAFKADAGGHYRIAHPELWSITDVRKFVKDPDIWIEKIREQTNKSDETGAMAEKVSEKLEVKDYEPAPVYRQPVRPSVSPALRSPEIKRTEAAVQSERFETSAKDDWNSLSNEEKQQFREWLKWNSMSDEEKKKFREWSEKKEDDSPVDYSKGDLSPVKSCVNMDKFKSKDILKVNAEKRQSENGIPAYCKVRGVIDPEIAFEVNLPDKWNGRFYMIGNGGHAGQSLDDPMQVSQVNDAMKLGFAVALTNTGHDTTKEPGASFVMSNPQKAIDYAYRAVHLTAVRSKEIVKDYYGRPADYSYWNSCSNGGRQGMIEAQRYPEDFDGIIANAPWLDQTGFTIGAMWNQRALDEAPLTAEKLAILADRVMAKCDMIDGIEDGLINDPRECNFDPLKDLPMCPEGEDRQDCFTQPQAVTISKIYNGPVSKGKNIFPGFMPGSEAIMPAMFGGGEPQSGWMNLIVSGFPGMDPADFSLAQDTMRYLVHKPPKPDYDCATFDFDHDIHMLDEWGSIANAKETNLTSFRKRGGKLLMTYGWSDPVLQPMAGVNYYEEALRVNGPDTKDFFRLFMIPGMSHCSGGFCPDQHDPVTAIVNWVEKGIAPEKIEARQIKDGKVVRTRPLCPYPEVSRYKGKGSIDDASSFECVKP